jgi:hypothetical protein
MASASLSLVSSSELCLAQCSSLLCLLLSRLKLSVEWIGCLFESEFWNKGKDEANLRRDGFRSKTKSNSIQRKHKASFLQIHPPHTYQVEDYIPAWNERIEEGRRSSLTCPQSQATSSFSSWLALSELYDNVLVGSMSLNEERN